ncbi:universal stress protein [Bacillus sp. FJAT-47783]|uniref:universal stress protein n=1 Tax=Bacillus sp. FJAT-47783 TaxID=2922712 RepID=UPI001FABB664|nr:universal stress protein [Bacillus sp. FJAT-47783]
MENNLLIALDGTNHSKNAVEKTRHLCSIMHNCRIHIIHVFTKSPSLNDLESNHFNVSQLLYERAVQQLRPLLRLFEEANCQYHLEVAIGDPAKEILDYAKKIRPFMVIVGSRGLSTLGEVLLGSVSHKLVHESDIPVLVVK